MSTPDDSALERILARLNERQRRAVTAPPGPLLIIAGAGSGKTSVLTRRVAYRIAQGVPAHRILAVTFTNKAAGEMRRRIERMLDPERAQAVWMSTFHSFANRFLRIEHEAAGLPRHFSILDEDDQRSLAKGLCTDALEPAKSKVNDLLGRISLAKGRMQERLDLEAAAESREDELAAMLWRRYEEALARVHAVDFDDLLLMAVRTLERDARVRDKWQQRFAAVFIDEFQDTNPVQARLADVIAASHRDLTVVGDPGQSIFGWRGAHIGNILEFEQRYPGCTVVRLEENYRSTQPVLDAANVILGNATEFKANRLRTVRSGGARPTLVHCEDAEEEAKFVLGRVRDLEQRGLRLADMAVLYRTSAQSQPFEEICLRTGTKYRIVGGIRFFERREVKDVLAHLAILLNPDHALAFSRALNTPARGLGDKARTAIIATSAGAACSLVEACRRAPLPPKQRASALAFAELVEHLGGVARTQGLAALVREAATRSGYIKALLEEPDGKERAANVEQLANIAADQEESEFPASLETFLAHAALMSSLDEVREGEDALTLMTLHAAKGLEYGAVFLVGCDEGLLPHRSSYGERAQEEEERRLAYVGVTRAKDHLFLLSATRRQVWGSWEDMTVSRYMREMLSADALAELTPRAASSRRSPHWRDERSGRGPRQQPPPLMRPAMKRVARTYGIGQKVLHTHFGEGTITALAPFGEDDQLLSVLFVGAEKERKLLASVSPLRVIA